MVLLQFKLKVSSFFKYLFYYTGYVFSFSRIVLGCQNLPKMDVIGSSDPYVILELLPFTIYHKPQKEYKTVTQNRTVNPQYNEVFQW
jgi:hypothetical protein